MTDLLDKINTSAPGFIVSQEDVRLFTNSIDVAFGQPIHSFYEGDTKQLLDEILEKFEITQIYELGIQAGFMRFLQPQSNPKRAYEFTDKEVGIIWDFFEPYEQYYKTTRNPLQAIHFLKQAVFDIVNSIYLQGYAYGTRAYFNSKHRGIILFER